MFDLIELTDRTYYIDLPTKIGVYRTTDTEVMLIDSGINEKTAARVCDILSGRGLRINSVINTHAHTDHAGGDRYLRDKCGCEIYATAAERIYIEHPDLEPAMVYGGYPCRDFRRKFMNTPACAVNDIATLSLPQGMEIFPLPGHFIGMIGVKTPDEVYFVADSVNGRTAMEHARICYVFDVARQFETLEYLKSLNGKLCVPAHTNPTREIAALAELNAENLRQVQRDIIDIIKEPSTVETIVAALTQRYGLRLEFMNYVMIASAVRSHLSCLRHSGQVEWCLQNNLLYWHLPSD